ncbi:MAG: PQQ-binding-like beta-propeller repeat protein [Verrucomicrobiota bacterium]
MYYSNWREAPLVATDRQFNVGAIFSSPLVVSGVVYFGSTDGYLYALD